MAVKVEAKSSELYEQDLYAWSEVQADLPASGAFPRWTWNTLSRQSRTWAGACIGRSVRGSDGIPRISRALIAEALSFRGIAPEPR